VPEPETHETVELQLQLAVLRAIPCTSAVSAYDRNKAGQAFDLNKAGVKLKLDADPKAMWINVHFNEERQSLLACALAARMKVESIVGKSVVTDAEKEVAIGSASASLPPALIEMTEEEKEWLAAWCDEQPEPAYVTLEDAAAALTAHRASSDASAFAILTEAQLLRARYRATEIKIAKAIAERERLRALIPEEQPQKRQRRREEARPYDEYTLQEFLRQESWLWARRSVELSDEAPARLPSELPRGERDGPLQHWRRGLVGAVQDWAEGSKFVGS